MVCVVLPRKEEKEMIKIMKVGQSSAENGLSKTERKGVGNMFYFVLFTV